jgi:hypothetical protein
MTYRLDSEVPVTYVSVDLGDRLRRAVAPKRAAPLLAAFISSGWNCSGREEYFEELLHWLPIDSYGRSHRNKILSDDRGAESKLAALSGYRFTLAFENARGRDYVTEKFYDPLIAGSVPVYLGAPNIEAFAPGERCFIDAADFPDPKDLAAFLQHLAGSEDDYLSYLAWKGRPYRESFQRLLTLAEIHPFSRLFRRLNQLFGN